MILKIALFIPLSNIFDYFIENREGDSVELGSRVKVDFANREQIGVVVAKYTNSNLSKEKIKPIIKVIDDQSILPKSLIRLYEWTLSYYHAAPGVVFNTILPKYFKLGAAAINALNYYQLTKQGKAIDVVKLASKASKQAALLSLIRENEVISAQKVDQHKLKSVAMTLLEKQWIKITTRSNELQSVVNAQSVPKRLMTEQQASIRKVVEYFNKFQPFVLHGVTGSGKTEVYLQLIAKKLQLNLQTLILVPEIGLTVQFLQRLDARFPCASIACLHSGISDKQRWVAWEQVRNSDVDIVIGTRSAVFLPFKKLGLVIVDEEHDMSYKQQDGFRYSARDIAIKKAQISNIPIILGSATPALESLNNVILGNHIMLKLSKRVYAGVIPEVKLIDMRGKKNQNGLSATLVQTVDHHLKQGNQVLIFLNRRGYAPVLMCHDCGWHAECNHCDANLTLHGSSTLCCHHCGFECSMIQSCPVCHSSQLLPIGYGTERIEQELVRLFPDFPLIRVDRDTTQRKGQFDEYINTIEQGNPLILLGTQMISKGHHFPNISLVGVINVDQGLFSVDFRAAEKLVQQVIQVIGRAGRSGRPATVILQTYQPKNSIYESIIQQDYLTFAKQELTARKQAMMPPISYMALLSVNDVNHQKAKKTIEKVKVIAPKNVDVHIYGPAKAPIFQKANRYYYQILILSANRRLLHQWIDQWLLKIYQLSKPATIRWSLDIDPQIN